MSRSEEFQAQTVAQLRKLAREAGLTGVSKLNKTELVERLLEAEAESPAASQAAPSAATTTAGRPLLGLVVQICAGLGLIISLLAALALPLVGVRAGRAAQQLLAGAADSARSLAVTARTSRSSIDAAALGLENASQTLRTVESGLANSDPLLEATAELLGEELPQTVESTHEAILGAQGGAAAIDTVLRGLSRIALLGVEYSPDQPLDESMAQTAASLEPLPGSLRALEGDLQSSRDDLRSVRAELETTARDLQLLSDELAAMADTLQGYAGDLRRSADKLDRAAELAPAAGRWAGALTGLAALGLAASQYAAVTVGGMLRRGRFVGLERPQERNTG